jgi:hypothetical protein
MKRLIPIVLLLVGGIAHAEEPITGAFGQALSDVANGSLRNRQNQDGYFRYRFTPKTPVTPFKYYYVDVTPVKELVFLIMAQAFVGVEGCTASYNAFKKTLNRKYGASVTSETSGGTRRATWRRKKGGKDFRQIALWCSSDYIALTYKDYFVEEGMADELSAETESGNL